MRRAYPLRIESTVYSAIQGLSFKDGEVEYKLKWQERFKRWELETPEGETVVQSTTLEGLEEAYKIRQRKIRNAPFKRTDVIVFPSYGGEPWEGVVTSWAQTRYSRREVWVTKNEDSNKKERVQLDQLRIPDDSELQPYFELKVDRGLMQKKIRDEVKRLSEALKPLILNDKDHPQFDMEGNKNKAIKRL